MKNGNQKSNWLNLVIVAAVLGLNPSRAVAQDDPEPATKLEVESTEEVSTNVVTEVHEESEWEKRWRERSERHEQFAKDFRARRGSHHREAIVAFGHDVILKTNETTDTIVVIGGSAKVQGWVREAVVAIGGNVKIEGGHVGQEVVAVMGSVDIESDSRVHGDVVSVGGRTEVAENAVIEGDRQEVDFEQLGLPKLEWLQTWLVQCVFKLRPLSFQVAWIWWFAAAFLLLYLLVAVAVPRPVAVCVDEMTRRPATTFFMGLLTKLVTPVITLVLIATGIGIVVVPFLVAALFFAALVGKVAFLEYLGKSTGKLLGTEALSKPILALLVGSALLALLYLVPVLGLIVFAVSALWGLGAAVTVAFGSLRRESPPRPTTGATPNSSSSASSAPASAPMSSVTPFAAAAEPSTTTFAGTEPLPSMPAGTETPFTAAPLSAAPGAAWTYPRASFWERMGAAFLDLALCGVIGGLVGGPPQMFLVWLAYFTGMWTWKGTTVGGVVLNLKVVRLDDQPVTFVVALVRALATAFSAMMCFLGILWIAWDKESQGWHDRIAGTVVVRLPRGTPLV